ncbi:uncharacterized protein LOC123888992 [Trifolium pratense]|uniref:Uncharacterized protein n=1 Tax=Trifolium pratense TaxID=57577 RepID=A0ACB0IJI2_TRIPR|nr:uncharacterized protein LOC123888992 [Trifolium pratense]CAJ2632496.1 unnamed protein product [Trifolium pratense]
MPSGPKKRKAARRKKEKENNNININLSSTNNPLHANDDLKSQNEVEERCHKCDVMEILVYVQWFAEFATYLPEAMKQDSKEQKKEAIDQFKVSKLSLQGTLVNTFEELEIYVRGYEKFAKKVWCIGPMTS